MPWIHGGAQKLPDAELPICACLFMARPRMKERSLRNRRRHTNNKSYLRIKAWAVFGRARRNVNATCPAYQKPPCKRLGPE
eukprot:6947810-Pyramimonas_sp.AAC.1